MSTRFCRSLPGAAIQEIREDRVGKHVFHVFKTSLWRSALKLGADDMLRPTSFQ